MSAPASAAERTPPRWALPLVLALGLALRVVLLDRYPALIADEGGWPLSVREWAEEGRRTFDYFKAPGYHWLLGALFAATDASLAVARLASVAAGVAGLALLHGIALRVLRRPGDALVATLLVATSFAAALTDRRALIEPWQQLWALGLVWFWVRRGDTRLDAAGIALCTAAMLLTKASAIFLVPALAFAELVARRDDRSPGRGARLAALGAGLAITAAAFGVLYLSDPATFIEGWGSTVAASNPGGVPRTGLEADSDSRFGVHLGVIASTLGRMLRAEPLLFPLAAVAGAAAALQRRALVPAAWFGAGAAFLLLQSLVWDQHLVLMVPPAALLAAWALARLRPRIGARVALAGVALLALFGAARLGAAALRAGVPAAAPAIAWLAERADERAVVAAAPWVLMQLDARPVTVAAWGPDFLPTRERLQRHGVHWLVVDESEWLGWMALFGVPATRLDSALAGCCELETAAGGARVYRVR